MLGCLLHIQSAFLVILDVELGAAGIGPREILWSGCLSGETNMLTASSLIRTRWSIYSDLDQYRSQACFSRPGRHNFRSSFVFPLCTDYRFDPDCCSQSTETSRNGKSGTNGTMWFPRIQWNQCVQTAVTGMNRHIHGCAEASCVFHFQA